MLKLDLHGYAYEDVSRKVEQFINSNWGTGEAKIITGHSFTLTNIVTNLLKKYKLKYRVGNILNTTTAYIIVTLD